MSKPLLNGTKPKIHIYPTKGGWTIFYENEPEIKGEIYHNANEALVTARKIFQSKNADPEILIHSNPEGFNEFRLIA